MKQDKFYPLLINKMHEASIVPQQKVGFLTPVYRKIIPQIKYYPWKSLGLFSVLTALFLYYIFGTALVKLVGILQYGF
ncbi:hypothetical protein A2Y99_00165 [Candidatus Gottesmanbacteria bacterium RBG_13_37_7]|uniref:Uncharacterized protein n=1 Tax=Candidatus Gottesmanbacteria bacterium RBG_13_37_7 TaxID=1798369 RepID=A0A1F5YHU2_9BACT|nr:MAG: hypothetical protein A2Y99_00165 [Candidatus Gottesmanbacteria bacterium RBG_13_37_7]